MESCNWAFSFYTFPSIPFSPNRCTYRQWNNTHGSILPWERVLGVSLAGSGSTGHRHGRYRPWQLMTLFRGTELHTYSRLFKANHSQQNSSTNSKALFQRIVTPEATCFSSFCNQQDLMLFPNCSHPTCALLNRPRWQMWSGWGLGTELLPLH